MAKDWDKVGPTDRQYREPPGAYSGFVDYLTAGPGRSLEKTAIAINRSISQTRLWSSRWHWVARVQEYEGGLLEAKVREFENSVTEMRMRHAEIGQRFIVRLGEAIEKIDPATISVEDMCVALRIAVQVEREARGAVSESNEREGLTIQMVPAPRPEADDADDSA